MQQISYNAFKSPVEIVEQGHERISFQYNASMGRAHMYYGGDETDKMQRRYRKHYSSDGSMEITHDTQTGKTIFITYIGGDAYSAPAIWREEHTASAATEALYYLHRDYLGSILAITDVSGTVKEKRHFDAWGNIVKLTNGSGTALDYFVILDRGYTGHEHLIGVGLIHMNGRLYDPMLHRFLSPDNYVQDAFNTQNFNRYAYALNNPLMYVDPDGEFIVAALIGAAIGVITNGINNVVHDRAFFKGAGKAALFGAIGGAASFGIGTLATNIASSAGSLARSAFQAGAHSLLGGTLSAMDGGNFWSGALAGGISSAIASGVGAFGIKSNTWKSIAGIGGGSVSGGIGSVIAGGNFWNGFGQGALTAGLNHFAHSKYEKIRQANYTKEFNAQLEATRKFFEALKQTNVLDPDPFYSDMYALGKFIELVGPGGPYDLKNDKNSIFSINKLRKYDGKAMYNGEVFKAEDFGNYNFGVAAKAFGLSLSFSQFGAGIVQILSGTSSWDFMNTYFDDPRDTYMIGRGYNHFD